MNNELTSVLEEYNRLGIQQQLDYDKFYLYSIITHSTAIEGSTVTEIENQLLFDEGISAHKPMAEQLMNLDLKAAYEQSFIYAKEHTDFSIEMLCNLASLVMKNTGSTYKTIAGDFSSAKGELRLLNVSAGRGGKSYLAWQKVNDRLEQFCKWINEERKKINKYDIQKIYELSFETHYRIVSIHPWADAFEPKAQTSIISNYANGALATYGNGRMSRLVMNMIQYEAGVIPSIVKREKRVEYIKSLSQSQDEDDSAKFIDFMMKHHIQNLKQQILDYKNSMESDSAEGGQKNNGGQKKWSETTQRVFNLIKANPNISRKQLCEELNINPSAIQKHIEKLKEQNAIKRQGGAKGGWWEIVE